MAIKIQQIADNFQRSNSTIDKRADSDANAKRVFAKSNVYHRLFREMVLYAQRETSGRSFLISGYRGAGKTMVVGNTIQDVTEHLEKERFRARPLYVRMHGPDLLPSEERREAANQLTSPAALPETATSGTTAAQPADPANSGSDSEIVLKQVVIALYRTAADEFWHAFRDRIYEKDRVSEGEKSDLLELVAQLRVELDAAADLACFRTIWKRAGKLSAGVLFPEQRADPLTGFEPSTAAEDQGFLELMALSSAAQAYRVISGKITETQVSSDEAKRQDTWSLALSSATKNLAGPFTGLAAGALAGLAVHAAAPSSPYAAVVTGVLSGLTVTLTLGYSGTRSRDTSKKVDISFLPDRSLASLDRMIPLLVERFRIAGLAPIFVVDELDKVPDPFKRIGELVDQLKHFITERAFFCFLTDRSYIEKLERDSLKLAYPKQHTYFSDRLLVYYMPRQLHDFLKQGDGILQIVPAKTPEVQQTEAADIEVLPYVLLHRSRMHAFDLRRELARFTDEGQVLRCLPGVIRTWRRYLFDLLIQVAVEYLLEQPDLLSRNVDDPYFTQLALDALYYPSRSWERGEAMLDLSQEAFKQYIGERIGEYSQAPAQVPPAWMPISKPGKDAKSLVSASDSDLLYGSAKKLAEFLVDPRTLFAAIEHLPIRTDGPDKGKPRFSPIVLDALPSDELLLKHDKPKDHYRWQADVSGRLILPLTMSQAQARWTGSARDIGTVNGLLTAVGGARLTLTELTSGLSVLPSSPSWLAVDQSLQRLSTRFSVQNPGDEEVCEDQIAEDSDAVYRFSKMLHLNRRALTYALLLAALLDRYAKGDILDKLKLISTKLGLQNLRSSETADLLSQVWGTWQRARDFAGQVDALQGMPILSWASSLQGVLGQVRSGSVNTEEPEDSVLAAWSAWKTDPAKVKPTANDLVALAVERGPLKVLDYDFSAFSVYRWSNIAVHPPQEEGEFLKNLARAQLALGRSRKDVLLVLAGQNSSLQNWKPDSNFGCLAVQRSSLTANPDPTTRFDYAFIELSGSPAELATELRVGFAEVFANVTPPPDLCLYVTVGRPKADDPASPLSPYINSPSSLADAVQKAEASRPPRPAAPEKPDRSLLLGCTVVTVLLVVVSWLAIRFLYQPYRRGSLAGQLAAASNNMLSKDRAATPASVLLALEAMRFDDSPDTERALRNNLRVFPTTLQRPIQKRPVQALFSKAAAKLVVLGGDGIQIWSGPDYRTLDRNIPGVCSSADFSPDGFRLAAVCGKVVLTSFGPASAPDRPLPPEQFLVDVFSNNQVLLLANDKGVRIWDIESGKDFARSAHYQASGGRLKSLAASPDGRSFVYASDTATAVWEFKRNSTLPQPLSHVGTINDVAYARAAKDFDFATAGQNGFLLTWKMVNGAIANTHHVQCPGPVSHVAIGPKARFVAGAFGAGIILWNSVENRQYTLKTGGVVSGMDFSADGELLAAASTNGQVTVWELSTERQIMVVPTQGPATSVVFSPDSKNLAVTADVFQMWKIYGITDPEKLSGEALINEACSRIQASPKIDWKQYLGSEVYRPVCKQF